jgi:hypothetical protein
MFLFVRALICFALALCTSTALAQNIKFRFNPPLNKEFIEERTRRVITDTGVIQSHYQETWKTRIHFEREGDLFAMIRDVESISAEQDKKPVEKPAGSFYKDVRLEMIIDATGTLIEVRGNEALLANALQAIPKEEQEAFKEANTPQKMFHNQKEEWDRRLGFLAGKTLKVRQRTERQLSLPGVDEARYTLTFEVHKVEIKDGRPWVTLISASSTDPAEIETLLDAAKQNRAEEAIMSKQSNAAFVYRGISIFVVDANTMQVLDDKNFAAYVQSTVVGDKVYFKQARYELDEVKISPKQN